MRSAVRRLTIGKKIAVILAVVAIPLGMTTRLYLQQVATDVGFASAEVTGARQIEALWGAATSADRAAAAARMDAFRKLEPEREIKPGDAVATIDAFTRSLPGGNAADIADAAQGAIGAVADRSNLTLDPDLDSFYVMDAVTVRLPELRTALLRMQAQLNASVGAGKIDIASYREAVDAGARVRLARAAALRSLGSAQDGNADGAVRRALAGSTASFKASGDATAAAMDKTLRAASAASVADMRAIVAAVDSELAALQALWSPAQAELVRLLRLRISGFENDRLLRMSEVAACLALAALVLAFVIRSIRRPLGGVLQSIGRFQAGDFLTPVRGVELNNEFGDISRALKRLQGMSGEHALTTAGLNGSGAMLMITDAQERITFMSAGLLDFFMQLEPHFRSAREDFSIAAMYGAHIDYYRQNPNLRRELMSDDGRRRRVRYEVGGYVIDVDMSYVHDGQGAKMGHALVWTDITQELAAEREIATIVQGAARGDFSQRVDMAGKKSAAREIAQGLNSVSDLVEAAVHDFGLSLGALAAGDLTRPVQGDYTGVFGELKASIDNTTTRLSETVAVIQQTAAEISTAAGEIRAGSEDLASRTEDQAASLEESAATTEELAASVKASAQAALQAAGQAENAKREAEEGGLIVGEAVRAIGRIEAASRRIADITTVIDEIAFQTNLLALNAAVEAARAGDAGKGFAVVASEVRTLAQRSADAAKSISGLIAESVSEVGSGVKLGNAAGNALGRIVEASHAVADTIAEISSASREQATGIDEISQSVSNLDNATQQNAALAEQSAASASMLSQQIEGLNALVSEFRTVKQGGGRAAAHANQRAA